MSRYKKILLTENQIPRHWYNIQADMPNPLLPPLHPGTRQPLSCLFRTSRLYYKK